MAASSRYRAAIIGAGRIGSGFDAPDSPHVLTHAHAIATHSRADLAAIVDTDHVRGVEEARKWGTTFFPDIDDMFTTMKPDIIVIATPDDTHAKLLQQVVGKNPRLIICEKPVATSEGEAHMLRELNIGVPILVNFRRRFDTIAQRVAREIQDGVHGTVISASGIYDRGIFHNGSHMLDLARMLFGEMKSATPHFSLDDLPDGLPSVSGVATFERCPEFFLMHGDGRHYSLFELDICMEKKRIRFFDEGMRIEISKVVNDPLFAGFKTLGEGLVGQTSLKQAMPALIAHAVAVLDGTEMPRSSLDNALKTHDACAAFAGNLK